MKLFEFLKVIHLMSDSSVEKRKACCTLLVGGFKREEIWTQLGCDVTRCDMPHTLTDTGWNYNITTCVD